MRDAEMILSEVVLFLPTIRQELGNDWPAFADQLRAQAQHFNNLSDAAALDKSANQLYGLFMKNETAREVILSLSGASDLEMAPKPVAESALSLNTITNRFSLLCEQIDEFDNYDSPDEFFQHFETTGLEPGPLEQPYKSQENK